MKRMLILTAALSLALSACGQQSTAQKTDENGTTTGTEIDNTLSPAANQPSTSSEASGSTGQIINESDLAAPSTAQGFVQRVAMSDLYEITAAKLVLSRNAPENIKSFAQAMVDAHQQTTQTLKGLASSDSVSITDGMTAEQQDWIADLNKASDTDLAKTYLDQQVKAHQAALKLMNDYAADGDVANLKAFAQMTAPMVQDHLSRAQGLVKTGAPS